MSSPHTVEARAPFTPVQWLICIIAAIGFAFDIYELLMLPLIVRPALMELANLKPGSPEFNQWVGLLFWVPGRGGRFVRSARRLSYRPIRPTSGAGVEHSTIRNLRAGCRLCHIAAGAAISPNHDICRRLRRVRSGGGLARRTVPAIRSAARRSSDTPRRSRRSVDCSSRAHTSSQFTMPMRYPRSMELMRPGDTR